MKSPLRTDTWIDLAASLHYQHWKVAFEFQDENNNYASATAEFLPEGVKVALSKRFKGDTNDELPID